jgi:aspartate aminotransferase
MVLRENERRLPDEKKLYILFDAMYGNLATKASSHHNPITVCPEVKPYVITLGAISKVFAATGVRVGWCLGPSPVLQKMKNLLTHMGAWAPMAEQKAVARFLPQTDAIKRYLKNFKGELNYRLDAIYTGIKNLRKGGFPIDAVAPQGGLYLSIRIDLIGRVINGKKIETAADISEYLLQQSSFAVLPFSVFGSSDELPWFRISVGTSQKWDIPVMIKKLEEALTPFRFVEQPLSSI